MCGIAGYVSATTGGPGAPPGLLRAMTGAIAHRGPDAEGHWSDLDAGVALGHRRLSILDLSPAGAQPMASACGRWMVAFNGEIYNHLSLRARLADEGRAPAWRGHSDTETLLAAIAAWGLAPALRALCGMFALALWDRETGTLHLARDRMGEKPLLYGLLGGLWAFGSELGALRVVPGFAGRLDPGAVAAYLARGHVPDGASLIEGLSRVAPGGLVTLRPGAAPVLDSYESFADLATAGRPLPGATTEARAQALEGLLEQVVAEQSLSDVPLGCFLSGGVDSSLVAALMQAGSDRQVATFSVGFTDPRFDESPHADAVARHLGTAHTAFRISEEDALAVIPDLPAIYDEPFADSSQIPTVLLCRAARRHVTVALTGDGADEVFGGYNRHVLGPALLARLHRVPRALRRPGGRLLARAEHLSRSAAVQALARRAGLPVTFVDKLGRLGAMAAEVDTLPDLYRHLTRGILDPSTLMPGAPAVPDAALPAALAGLAGADWMMAQDAIGYLPGDILVKVDRAAMAVALETRAPMLDARVVAAAWSLPPGDRIDGRTGKAILRRILHRHVPAALVERPKQGFAVPLDRWLREGLAGWAGALLAREDLALRAGLDPAALRALWARHRSGTNEGQRLWTVLMLLAWIERNGGAP